MTGTPQPQAPTPLTVALQHGQQPAAQQPPAQPAAPAPATPAAPAAPAWVAPASREEYDRQIAEQVAAERAKYPNYDDLKTKAAQFDQQVNAQKTDAQKTAERIAELEQENKRYKQQQEVAQWAREVAAATGVPAGALRGGTREELTAHAETLKPLLAPAAPAPLTVPSIGQQPQNPGNVPLRDQIAAAEAAGDKTLVQNLKALSLGSAPASTS